MLAETVNIKELWPGKLQLLDIWLPVIQPPPRWQHQCEWLLFVEQFNEVCNTHVDISTQVETLTWVYWIEQVPADTEKQQPVSGRLAALVDVCPTNKEPFLNHLARVILVHNWYCSTSMCFHVYSREYTCSACCHKFWMSFTRVVLGQNWYGFTDMCHHVKNSWFHGKHHICSQNPVNSRELSQLNSWIHFQNMSNHGSLFAGMVKIE